MCVNYLTTLKSTSLTAYLHKFSGLVCLIKYSAQLIKYSAQLLFKISTALFQIQTRSRFYLLTPPLSDARPRYSILLYGRVYAEGCCLNSPRVVSKKLIIILIPI